jgi:hypothetical protein
MLASKQLILAVVSVAEEASRTCQLGLGATAGASTTGIPNDGVTGTTAEGMAVPRAAVRPRLIFAIVSIGLFMVSIGSQS